MGLYGLTLGYDYLSLKSPMEKKKHLWWKQLSHAKNNQSNNTRNLGNCLMNNVIMSLPFKIAIGTEQTWLNDLGIYTGPNEIP